MSSTTEAAAADTTTDPEPDGYGPPPNPRAPSFPTIGSLLRAAHLRQGLGTAFLLGLVALAMGRDLREVGVVVATVLVGQTVLGWHNDLVDADRDHRHDAPGKPVAQGLLEPGTVWYAIGVGALVLVPLAVSNGLTAATWYLGSVVVGLAGNLLGRTRLVSWWPWALTWAMYVPFLTHGGWGGRAVGYAPDWRVVALAALFGVGVHVLVSLRGLLPDHKDGSRSLPLRLATKLGAPRVLSITLVYLFALAAVLAVVAPRAHPGG